MPDTSPHDYGVPHDSWRPNQYAFYKNISQVIQSGGGFVIAEAGTGSGKSAISTAMGHDDDVLVVCHTLALLSQYEALYNFSVIRGRQEYPCVLPQKVAAWQSTYQLIPTAADCHFSPMHKCQQSNECPYLVAKHRALSARRAACTYRYIGVSQLMKERTGNIVLDEAHDAAEELIRFNEFVCTAQTIKKYSLQQFPIPTYGPAGKGAALTGDGKAKVATWLTNCIAQLQSDSDAVGDDMEETKRLRVHSRFQRMLESLYTTEWFLQVKSREVSLKALDAASVARQVFAHKSTKLLMSATIGDPELLAKALGIHSYKFLSFPHPVPATHRSIKQLDVDRMTARNLKERPRLYKEQADTIWNWIMQMSPSWRGVILTTSYKKIEELYHHFIIPSSIVPNKRRVLIQRKGMKVGELVKRYIDSPEPGDIMIGTIQGWGSGLDLRGELARWIVIAGVPHVNPTDEYAKARRQLDGGIAYQYWVTYNAVMQACGRCSRGEKDEYGDWLPNYAALADGSAVTKTAMKYYSSWFLEAMI